MARASGDARRAAVASRLIEGHLSCGPCAHAHILLPSTCTAPGTAATSSAPPWPTCRSKAAHSVTDRSAPWSTVSGTAATSSAPPWPTRGSGGSTTRWSAAAPTSSPSTVSAPSALCQVAAGAPSSWCCGLAPLAGAVWMPRLARPGAEALASTPDMLCKRCESKDCSNGSMPCSPAGAFRVDATRAGNMAHLLNHRWGCTRWQAGTRWQGRARLRGPHTVQRLSLM